MLLAANYLNYAAFYACLAADYLIWGRKRRPLARADWLWLIVPQALLGTPIVLVWNPLGKVADYYQTTNWLADKATLLWWNWHDLNQCEYGAAILILLAPLCYAHTRWDGLLRLPLAAFIYVAAITIASPQWVGTIAIADIRYLAPMIPLYMVIGVLCLRAISPKPLPAALLGIVLFGTNLIHGGPLFDWGLGRPSVSYVRELARPPGDPYTTAAHWINANVPPGCSVFVRPESHGLSPDVPRPEGHLRLAVRRHPPRPSSRGSP